MLLPVYHHVCGGSDNVLPVCSFSASGQVCLLAGRHSGVEINNRFIESLLYNVIPESEVRLSLHYMIWYLYKHKYVQFKTVFTQRTVLCIVIYITQLNFINYRSSS